MATEKRALQINSPNGPISNFLKKPNFSAIGADWLTC